MAEPAQAKRIRVRRQRVRYDPQARWERHMAERAAALAGNAMAAAPAPAAMLLRALPAPAAIDPDYDHARDFHAGGCNCGGLADTPAG